MLENLPYFWNTKIVFSMCMGFHTYIIPKIWKCWTVSLDHWVEYKLLTTYLLDGILAGKQDSDGLECDFGHQWIIGALQHHSSFSSFSCWWRGLVLESSANLFVQYRVFRLRKGLQKATLLARRMTQMPWASDFGGAAKTCLKSWLMWGSPTRRRARTGKGRRSVQMRRKEGRVTKLDHQVCQSLVIIWFVSAIHRLR